MEPTFKEKKTITALNENIRECPSFGVWKGCLTNHVKKNQKPL